MQWLLITITQPCLILELSPFVYFHTLNFIKDNTVKLQLVSAVHNKHNSGHLKIELRLFVTFQTCFSNVTDLELYIISLCQFGKHVIDKLVLCVYYPVWPTLVHSVAFYIYCTEGSWSNYRGSISHIFFIVFISVTHLIRFHNSFY